MMIRYLIRILALHRCRQFTPWRDRWDVYRTDRLRVIAGTRSARQYLYTIEERDCLDCGRKHKRKSRAG